MLLLYYFISNIIIIIIICVTIARRCVDILNQRVFIIDPKLLSHKLILNATLYLPHGNSTTKWDESVVHSKLYKNEFRNFADLQYLHG